MAVCSMSEPPRQLPRRPARRVESTLRIARIVPSTAAEGPGLRTAIWVQGCSIRCPGCFNPHLWAPTGANRMSVEEVLDEVLDAETQGATFLGGEPFDQAHALGLLARALREAGRSVMTFTGYTLKQLENAIAAGRTDVDALLRATDLLVDGPYRSDRRDESRPWVGSDNQRFHFLTDRYADLARAGPTGVDRLEIRVDEYGTVSVNGWAAIEHLEALLHDLGERAHAPASTAGQGLFATRARARAAPSLVKRSAPALGSTDGHTGRSTTSGRGTTGLAAQPGSERS